jgi:uncharacterized membrane protein YoaK (UPF0700 family)
MIYVLLIIAVIALINLRPLFKNGPKRDAIILSVFFAGVLAICMLTAAEVAIPSPMVAIGDLFRGIGLAYPPLQ